MTTDFQHQIFDDVLTQTAAKRLKLIADGEDRRKLHEESFFSQYDFAWVRRTFGRLPVGEPSPEMIALRDAGRELIEKHFRAIVGRHYTIVGHKMVPGQLVGIHNDSPDGDRGRIE